MSRKTRNNGNHHVESSDCSAASGLRVQCHPAPMNPAQGPRDELTGFMEHICTRSGAINAVVFNTGSLNEKVQVTAKTNLVINRFLMKHLASQAAKQPASARERDEERESLVQCLPLEDVRIPGYGSFHLGLVFVESRLFFDVAPSEIKSLLATLSKLLNEATPVIHELSSRVRSKPLCSICNCALSSEIALLPKPIEHGDLSSRVCDTCAGKLLQLDLDNDMMPHRGPFEV